MRKIVIGDIHGFDNEFEALLETIGPIKSDDLIIPIGDYINGNIGSCQVYWTIRGLKRKYPKQIILLRGTHEDLMIGYYFPDKATYSYKKDLWFYNGGLTTVQSFELMGQDPKKAAQWFIKNTVFQYEEEDFVCVHAGLFTDKPTSDSDKIWMREGLYRGGKQKKLLIAGHTPTYHLWHYYKPSIPRDIKPPIYFPELNVINLDGTNFKYSNHLVGLDIINKKVYTCEGKIYNFTF